MSSRGLQLEKWTVEDLRSSTTRGTGVFPRACRRRAAARLLLCMCFKCDVVRNNSGPLPR